MEYSQNPFAKKPSFEEFLEEEFLLMGDVCSRQKKVALDIFQELVSTNITTNTEQPTLVSFIQPQLPQIQHIQQREIQHIEIEQREEERQKQKEEEKVREEIEKIETEIFSVKKKVEEERQIEEQMMIELEKMKSELLTNTKFRKFRNHF